MDFNMIAIFGLVPFGVQNIEGYLLPNNLWTPVNKFGISKTQAVMLAYPRFDRNNAAAKFMQLIESKKAKEVVPEGFRVHAKVKTDAGQGEAASVDLLPVDQLVPFLKLCKRMKSKAADRMIEDLAGLSVQQLFSDAFKINFGAEERQKFLLEWQSNRSELRDSHSIMCLGCENKGHPGAQVHDYMTTLIFGETAAAARMKTLIDEEEDATIGLNYQDDIPGMQILTNVKWKYARKRKGSWQEQVERSVEEVKKETGLVR